MLRRLAAYNIDLQAFGSGFDRLRAEFDRLAGRAANRRTVFVGFDECQPEYVGAIYASDSLAPPRTIPAQSQHHKDKLVVLALPMSQILTNHVELPDDALRSLDGAIRYSLSVWSPFDHTEAFAAAKRLSQVREGVQRIELRIVLKASILPAIETMRQRGRAPDALALGAPDYVVELNSSRPRILLFKLLCTFTLTISLMIQTLIFAHLRHAEIEREVAAWQRHFVVEARRHDERGRLRKEIASLGRPPNSAASHTPVALALIALADLFGENASINEIDLQNGRGRMSIASDRPLDIVDLMAKSSMFKLIDISSSAATSGGGFSYVITFTYAMPMSGRSQ